MTIVIVGAALAGLRSLQVLREHGYDGRVVVVGEEPYLPYDRTTLSKSVLAGAPFPGLVADPDALDARWRLGTPAVGLSTDPLGVRLQGGETLAADGVVIATGARARTLPALTDGLTLRTLDDCARLREALRPPGQRLVVIGGGLVGAEVAATAAEHGHQVRIVEADAELFVRQFGTVLATRLRAEHAGRGVELIAGAAATGSHAGELSLSGGGRRSYDVLVVGVGAAPNIEWLRSSGLRLDDGVWTDAWGVTSRPGVVAVGDVASYASARYGRLRTEHWTNARDMPLVAVPALLARLRGEPAEVPAYDPVPYFWSSQYGHHLQVAGRPGRGEVRFVEGDPQAPRFAAVELIGGQPVAAVAWDCPKPFARLRRELAETAPR